MKVVHIAQFTKYNITAPALNILESNNLYALILLMHSIGRSIRQKTPTKLALPFIEANK